MEQKQGTLHPLTLITNDIVRIFNELGFSVAMGPEMEDEWHNFDALNMPKDHPGRDMQDTFWIRGSEAVLDENGHSTRKVLRTQTSGVQVRYMEHFKKTNGNLPIAIICPGKVFRNEATDAGHEMQFHQLEGLLVGKDISMAHLKGVLLEFAKRFLGPEAQIRLRPSFFPFVEPALEVDVYFNGKWFEVLGSGLVHPIVLTNGGMDPNEVSGFAFGMGIERLAMIKYGIPDIRSFFWGDVRLNQF